MAGCVIQDKATSLEISRLNTRAKLYRVIAGVVRPEIKGYRLVSDKLVLLHRESILGVACALDWVRPAMGEQLGLVALGRYRRFPIFLARRCELRLMQIKRVAIIGTLTPCTDVDRNAVVPFERQSQRLSLIRRQRPCIARRSQTSVPVQAEFKLWRSGAAARSPFIPGASSQQVRGLALLQVDAPIGPWHKKLIFAVRASRRQKRLVVALVVQPTRARHSSQGAGLRRDVGCVVSSEGLERRRGDWRKRVHAQLGWGAGWQRVENWGF